MLKLHPRKMQLCLAGTIAILSSTFMLRGLAQVEPVGPPAPAQGWRAAAVVQGWRHPWGIAWLPDRRPIITAKHGTLHILTGGRRQQIPLDGLPPVFAGGQGGLL